ncbi:MAG TPA: RNA 2',3'-cyclic phosphodiesterase, partial [Sphingomicrobium sp.]|nr:RNA 2',3'-cyclic phosphodiesterase [Sphingomicrobium sp.]
GIVHRLFVAIRPPEDVRDLLIDAMDDSPALRWVGDEQLHLTLRFIGEVERPVANDIAAALERVRSESFALRIAGVGKFEQRNGGALWARIEPKEPVAALAAKVERAIQQVGLEPEHRAFMPHITLARWNRRNAEAVDAFLRRNSDLRSEPFHVDQFILFESRLSRHGPHYEGIASFPLH